MDVQVVVVDLALPAAVVARLDALLPAAERTARPAVRVLRATTREVLAARLGVAPDALEVSRRCRYCGHPTHGKPTLPGAPDVSFSVSHSGTIGVVAVAGDGVPVGVDIERVQPLDPVFLASIQTPSERQVVIAGEGADRDAAMTSLWSGKEALAKALGDALRYDPRRLESPVRWPEGRCGRWRAEALAGIDGHVGWVCWAVA